MHKIYDNVSNNNISAIGFKCVNSATTNFKKLRTSKKYFKLCAFILGAIQRTKCTRFVKILDHWKYIFKSCLAKLEILKKNGFISNFVIFLKFGCTRCTNDDRFMYTCAEVYIWVVLRFNSMLQLFEEKNLTFCTFSHVVSFENDLEFCLPLL